MKQNNATKTKALIERINQNQLNQSLDLNQWAFSLIEKSDDELKILELCCGTGKQTEQLLKAFKNSYLTCVDISTEALKIIGNSNFFNEKKIMLKNSDLDDFFKENEEFYDIVFVSYGLYYAKNIENVLINIFSCLNRKGRFIVLGPYGENNKQLFQLVNSIGIDIDKFVKYSSSDFMYSTVLRKVLGMFEYFIINTSVNKVKWNSPQEVMNYWENSTFYVPPKRENFLTKIKDHFSSNNYFVNEKHIMLLNCLKRK